MRPPSFKILSDFDGVWTHVALEAHVLRDHLIDACRLLLGRTAATVERDLSVFGRWAQDHPGEWGWAPDGRISAFADEDPLCEIAGLCHRFATAERGLARQYRDAIESQWTSVQDFAEHGFTTAMRYAHTHHPPSIIADAREQLQTLTELGAEVVVVSNSIPTKLESWFRSVGIDAGEGPGHALRIRGNAGKQVIGTSASLEFSGRSIYIDRPRYRLIIEQERPSLVIGDIFSLDLALPYAMRREQHPHAPRVLVLKRNAHTPAWVEALEGVGPPAIIDQVIDHIGDLAPIIASEYQ